MSSTGIFFSPHPFMEGCNCDRCSARANMLKSTEQEQKEIEEAKKKKALQMKKEKVVSFRDKLKKEEVKQENEIPINYDITLQDDVAEWFYSVLTETKQTPADLFDAILRTAMEQDEAEE